MKARNRYVILDHFGVEIDLFADVKFGWGKDYYIDVFRHIEKMGIFVGLTVYIAYNTPKSLPTSGPDVVLVIVGDEFNQHYGYSKDIGCILRCYGAWPSYRDGMPADRLSVLALLQCLYKMALGLRMRLRADLLTGLSASVDYKTLHIPLGLFQAFEPAIMAINERRLDYSFMGSVTDEKGPQTLLHRLLNDAKTISRRDLMKVMQLLAPKATGQTQTTANFEDSVLKTQDYASVMSDTKIAFVPRGTCYETYRFFEACKAGCVVICEPLPDTWFYRDHPGIVIRDWSKAKKLVTDLLKDENEMQARSKASLDYWRTRVSEAAVAEPVARFMRSRLAEHYQMAMAKAAVA